MASVTHTPPGVIQGTSAAQNVDLSTDELNMKSRSTSKLTYSTYPSLEMTSASV